MKMKKDWMKKNRMKRRKQTTDWREWADCGTVEMTTLRCVYVKPLPVRQEPSSAQVPEIKIKTDQKDQNLLFPHPASECQKPVLPHQSEALTFQYKGF